MSEVDHQPHPVPTESNSGLVAHLPGPWFVSRDNREGMEWNNHICSVENPHLTVCFMAHDGDGINARGEANAALVAAAPDLLGALRDASDELERYVDLQRKLDYIEYAADSQKILNAINAVIAKAEGRS